MTWDKRTQLVASMKGKEHLPPTPTEQAVQTMQLQLFEGLDEDLHPLEGDNWSESDHQEI